MKTVAVNFLAVLAGIIVGSVVNMGLVTLGHNLVSLPEGVDMSTPEGLRDGMKSLQPMHFLFPFLAHALGTFAGACVAAQFAASRALMLALSIGIVFLLGGIAMVCLVGGPLWFIVADLVVAYLPMGYLGAVLAGAKHRS